MFLTPLWTVPESVATLDTLVCETCGHPCFFAGAGILVWRLRSEGAGATLSLPVGACFRGGAAPQPGEGSRVGPD